MRTVQNGARTDHLESVLVRFCQLRHGGAKTGSRQGRHQKPPREVKADRRVSYRPNCATRTTVGSLSPKFYSEKQIMPKDMNKLYPESGE